MKNKLNLGNYKDKDFKQKVLKNSLRLRKFKSLFTLDPRNEPEPPKSTKPKIPIRKRLLLSKKEFELKKPEKEEKSEIVNQKINDKQKITTKRLYISKYLENKEKENEEEKINFNHNNKSIITINCNLRHKKYFINRKKYETIYKKNYIRYIKCLNDNKDKQKNKNKDEEEENDKEKEKEKELYEKRIKYSNYFPGRIKTIFDIKKDKNTDIPNKNNLKLSMCINKDVNGFTSKNNFNKSMININNKFNILEKLNNSKIENKESSQSIRIDKLEKSASIKNKINYLQLRFKQNNNNQPKNESKIPKSNKFSLGSLFCSNNINNNINENNSRNTFSKLDITFIPKISNKKETIDINRNTIKSSYIGKNVPFFLNFFEDIIELENSMNSKTYFNSFINDINKKYLMAYEKKEFIYINKQLNYCYKYFCIILIILIFLSKDDYLYEKNSKASKELFINYIYSSLFYTGYNIIKTEKIKLFLSKCNNKKKYLLNDCVQNLIELNFKNNKDYSLIYSITIQLTKTIIKDSINDLLSTINNSILYCFNTGLKSNIYKGNGYNKKKELFFNFKEEKFEKELEDNMPPPSPPFIKKKPKKKLCLVLDLDETIIHSIKLNQGYYFFVRPGAINFLKEVSPYFEIIFFTSSYKSYADFILDKIDLNKNLISHRLYKSHAIFEKGRSVKKLSMIGRDLNKTIFVDNLKFNAKYNMKNLYLITSWKGDIKDNEIYKLKNKLLEIVNNDKYNDDITKGLNINNKC